MSEPKFKVGDHLWNRVHGALHGTVVDVTQLPDGSWGYHLVFGCGEDGLITDAEKQAEWAERGILPKGAVVKGGALWAQPDAIEENQKERQERERIREQQ